MARRSAAALGVTLLVAVAIFVSPARANPAPKAQQGAVPVVFLDGKGFGHGVGLSQWGAEYMARTGQDHRRILSTFYPGTGFGSGQGYVRVAVFSSPNNVTTLDFPQGGEVRSALSGEQAAGFPVKVGPGGRVQIRFDGTYHVDHVVTARSESGAQRFDGSRSAGCIPHVNCPTTTTTTSPGKPCLLCTTTTKAPTTTTTRAPTTTGPPGSTTTTQPAARSGAPVWAVPSSTGGYVAAADRGRSYRGALEATAGAGPLRLINQVDVESYLKGMAEVPSSWPREAIAAQTVAARTWALRAMQFSGELCDYDRCQVYVGVTRETSNQTAAADATRGEVLTFRGALASTVYSADAGGVSATTLEGFGTPDGTYPYLTTVRYDTDNPLPWRSTVALSELAGRLGYAGRVDTVTVGEAGPSGRALAVTLSGSSGDMSVDGRTFASRLGLRSTLFTPTIGTADNVPPLPDVNGTVDQALPEDTAAISDAAKTTAPRAATPRTARRLTSVIPTRVRGALPGGPDIAAEPAALLALALIGAVTVLAARRFVPIPNPAQPRSTPVTHRLRLTGNTLRRWLPRRPGRFRFRRR
jgi:SpoIID/LytB domain protein